MRLSAIVAMSENRVIGRNNQLPWHLPADLSHFKKITLGNPIVMGRKTFLSIGRPLPGRRNIVISRDAQFQAAGCEIFHSPNEALTALNTSAEVFIIGGATLFQELLPKLQSLYLTIIHANITGDVYFPEIDVTQWQEIAREDHVADEKNAYAYSFVTLLRIPH